MRLSHRLVSRRFGRARRLSTLTTRSPRCGSALAELPDLSASQVDKLVADATDLSTSSWAKPSNVASRADSLRSLGAALRRDTERLARLETLDCGKPIAESRVDIGTCADLCDFYADVAAEALTPEAIDVPDEAFGARRVPYAAGVVACVTPWNYPLMQAVVKIAPAVAAGCATLLKPSPLASLTCVEFGKLCESDGGLPKSALTVITGGPPDGTADGASRLLSHPGVDFLSFTGSTRGGREMLAASAPLTRRAGLELGGKGAMIVFEDADVKSVVDWAMVGIFCTAGQICSATSRLLVHESIAPQLIDELKQATEKLRVGDPLDEATQMGAVISESAASRIRSDIDRAQADGATLLCGGSDAPSLGVSKVDGANLDNGYFVMPTILTEVGHNSAAWKEEIFGPVLCISTFTTEEEAVRLTNDSPYGLGHAVMSADIDRCERVADGLHAGTVWINSNQALWPHTPFGGWKASGFGAEWGAEGLKEYLRYKTVTNAKECGMSWNAFS